MSIMIGRTLAFDIARGRARNATQVQAIASRIDLRSVWLSVGARMPALDPTPSPDILERRHRQNECMRRLRAERQGVDLSRFKERIRRPKGQGLRLLKKMYNGRMPAKCGLKIKQ